MKRLTYFIVLVALGIILRIFLAHHAYPTLVFDAKTYTEYAGEFLRGAAPIDPRNKNMGYPLFLAFVFWIRGGADIPFVTLVQIFLDACAGIFVFLAARKVFSQKSAFVALFLYMINPFTSSYVGLVLPEAYSAFLVGLLLVVITNAHFRNNMFLWFSTGLLLGLLLFARYSLLTFSVLSIGCIALCCFKKEKVGKVKS